MVDKHRGCVGGWLGGLARLTGQMQGKLQFANVRQVAVVSYVMLMGHSSVACRGSAHPEVCKDPDPLLLSGGQSKHDTHHCECSCKMRMCATRLSKRATEMKLPSLDMANSDCLVIAPPEFTKPGDKMARCFIPY